MTTCVAKATRYCAVLGQSARGTTRFRRPARLRTRSPYRVLYLVILGLWVLAPFVMLGQGAQDGVTLLTGGDLFAHAPTSVYKGDEPTAQADPVYVASFCRINPPIVD